MNLRSRRNPDLTGAASDACRRPRGWAAWGTCRRP